MTYRWSSCVALQVEDLEKAKKFYVDVLGFELTPDEGGTLITKKPYSVYLEQGPKTEVWFELVVPQVAAAVTELLANGCTLHDVGGQEGEVFIKDPNGFIFHLYEERV